MKRTNIYPFREKGGNGRSETGEVKKTRNRASGNRGFPINRHARVKGRSLRGLISGDCGDRRAMTQGKDNLKSRVRMGSQVGFDKESLVKGTQDLKGRATSRKSGQYQNLGCANPPIGTDPLQN